jgi:hypothetical protein
MSDPYDLRRFVLAQQDFYDAAQSELRAGRKTSHWMWFIFPQIAGLGRSATAQKYAIGSLAAAQLVGGVPPQAVKDVTVAPCARRSRTEGAMSAVVVAAARAAGG